MLQKQARGEANHGELVQDNKGGHQLGQHCGPLVCLYPVCTRTQQKRTLLTASIRLLLITVSISLLYLEVPINDKAVVHMLQAQDDFSSIEAHFFFTEHSMLREMVVQVTP